MLAEYLAAKHDRFGWQRQPAEIRTMIRMDYMDVLQDYTIQEIRSSIRECERENPNRCPNEQHILKKVVDNRKRLRNAAGFIPASPPPDLARRDRIDQQAAVEILARAGFTADRMRAAQSTPMATTVDELDNPPERKVPRHWSECASEEEMEELRQARVRAGMIKQTQQGE